MNKLNLACLKSLVQTRPKGEWDFLTQLTLVWPEAKTHYWNRQGFRNLLSTWPFSIRGQQNSRISFLWLPEGKVSHGIWEARSLVTSFLTFNDQGEQLMTLVSISNQEILVPWTNKELRVWVHTDKEGVGVLLKPEILDLQYKEMPLLRQKVLKALKLAQDLGKTDIKSLKALAALTHKGLNQGLTVPDFEMTT